MLFILSSIDVNMLDIVTKYDFQQPYKSWKTMLLRAFDVNYIDT